MGQESSTPVDENTPPQTLHGRTLDAVASYIKEGRAKKIVVMVSLDLRGFQPYINSNRLTTP